MLLMTATPHNGNDEDFQLFLSLLDPERFEGQIRRNGSAYDARDLMRRMVKEELVKFDGTPLFPERRAYTVNYTLSSQEYELYEEVTDYVKTQMGKADQLAGARKGSVGFAMTTLQRRLASSPEAIHKSLVRRRLRLERRLGEELAGKSTLDGNGDQHAPQDDDDLGAEEREELEETVVDQATAARTVYELQQEILILKRLESQGARRAALRPRPQVGRAVAHPAKRAGAARTRPG